MSGGPTQQASRQAIKGDQKGRQYNGRDINKCKEAKNILGTSYNKEITREKSVKKEVRCKQIQGGLKIKYIKIKPIQYSLD